MQENSKRGDQPERVIKRKLDWKSKEYLLLLDQTQVVYEKILSGEDLENDLEMLIKLHNKSVLN
jgi:hypothetical protein